MEGILGVQVGEIADTSGIDRRCYGTMSGMISGLLSECDIHVYLMDSYGVCISWRRD